MHCGSDLNCKKVKKPLSIGFRNLKTWVCYLLNIQWNQSASRWTYLWKEFNFYFVSVVVMFLFLTPWNIILPSVLPVYHTSYTNLLLWMYTLEDIGCWRPFRKLSQCNKKLSYEIVIPTWVPVITYHFNITVIISIAQSSNRNWELLPSRI
jgi:hypothetical protein